MEKASHSMESMAHWHYVYHQTFNVESLVKEVVGLRQECIRFKDY